MSSGFGGSIFSQFGQDDGRAPDDQTSSMNSAQNLSRAAIQFILAALKQKIPLFDNSKIVQEEIIGSGATVEVWEGKYEGKLVAVKKLLTDTQAATGGSANLRAHQARSPALLETLTKELRYLTFNQLRKHSNIVPLLGISWEPTESLGGSGISPMTILELQDGTLTQYLLRDREPNSSIDLGIKISLQADILCGLAALHTVGLAHSDLKPDNILISSSGRNPIAKIADFGFSQQSYYHDNEPSGTAAWMCPEGVHALASTTPAPPNDGHEHHLRTTFLEYHAQITENPRIQAELDQQKAGDMFSFGLVTFFLLDDEAHLNGEEQPDWLMNKSNIECKFRSWLESNFRLANAESSSLELEGVVHSEWQQKCADGSWIAIPESISIDCLVGTVSTLATNPLNRPSSAELVGKLRHERHVQQQLDTDALGMPLIESLPGEEEIPIADIPIHMRGAFFAELLREIDRDEVQASPKVLNFLAMCYLDGDGVEANEEKGIQLLVKASRLTSSDEIDFHLVQIHQSVLVELRRCGLDASDYLSEDEIEQWTLESIFLLSGGYWFALGHRDQAARIVLAQQKYTTVLAYLDQHQKDMQLGIGLNLYVMRRPSECPGPQRRHQAAGLGIGSLADNSLRSEKYELLMASSVLSAATQDAHTLVQSRLNGWIDPWDTRIVRAVAHYGYEDSIRLLDRLETMSTANNPSLGWPRGDLFRRFFTPQRNRLLLAFDNTIPRGVQGQVFLPAVHECIVENRFACLMAMLALSRISPTGRNDSISLSNDAVVDDSYGLETPLQLAIRLLRPFFVCVLLAHGADCKKTNVRYGDNALQTCCRINVENHASSVHWDPKGYNPGLSVDGKLDDMKGAHRLIFKLLLMEMGPDLNERNNNGQTSYDLCVEAGNEEFARRLVECGYATQWSFWIGLLRVGLDWILKIPGLGWISIAIGL